jgi:spoIIIJ-associated protein
MDRSQGNRMTSVEIQAYSVEEAVRLALEQLERSEDEVDIEVLSDAGPDEDAEALVRVTAKGMASQPIPRGGGTGGRAPVGGRAPIGGGRGPSRGRCRSVFAKRLRARCGSTRPMSRSSRMSSASCSTGWGSSPMSSPSITRRRCRSTPTIRRRSSSMCSGAIANRRLSTWTRVVLDVEGYRTRREESLIGLADRVARQVARSRRPIVLEPMPPNERRIVHLTLRSHPDVTTESNGEGNFRRVTVQPRG